MFDIVLGCIIAFVIFIYVAIGFGTSMVFMNDSKNEINALKIFLAITGVILWPIYVVLGNVILAVQKKGEK